MARTTMLRRQHDAAVQLVQEISASIYKYKDERDAFAIAMQLAKLAGLLRIHFAQEDRSLYPAMMASPDRLVAATAEAYQAEMGDIGPLFDAYVERWGTSTAIAANFGQFQATTADLFGKLANRIERENDELYHLADTVAEPLRPAA